MKRLLAIIVSVLFLLSPNILKASHFAGADLTYTCLGGNTYLITYSFYRDCSGISAPSSVNMFFNCSSNSSLNFYASLPKIPGTGQEITQACSAVPTHCNNGNGYGIQEYVYQGVVTLTACNSWKMYYTSGARNPISTVMSVGTEEDSDSPLKIYPNPVQNYINIELQKDYPESNIEILDLNGKLISKSKFSGAFYKLKSLNTLPKGVYILHLQNKELNVLLRFVKE